MFLSVETIKSQVTRDLCCKTKTGDYNVLSLLSWQRSCTTRWASIKGTWKSWQLASWLNLKCEKKLFQMMPKWPGEVFLGCGKRWKTSQVFFLFLSGSFVKKIQHVYHKLTNSFIWPALTFTAKKSLKQKTFITSGNNEHLFFFFHAAFLNTSKPLTAFAASCIQLPNIKCLPDQIFHMKVFNIQIFSCNPCPILTNSSVFIWTSNGFHDQGWEMLFLHAKCKKLEGLKICIQIIALRLILKRAEVHFLSVFLI